MVKARRASTLIQDIAFDLDTEGRTSEPLSAAKTVRFEKTPIESTSDFAPLETDTEGEDETPDLDEQIEGMIENQGIRRREPRSTITTT